MDQFEMLSKALDIIEESAHPQCRQCGLPIAPGSPLCTACDREMMLKVRADLLVLHEERESNP